jgi:TonB-linked SusC/RagA family outer membrane protein
MKYLTKVSTQMKRLKMCRKPFVIIIASLLFIGQAYGQHRITGLVVDSKDQAPIPGVNVLVVGTSQGTITDLEGKYKIEIPDGQDVLRFSFIGYTSQEISVGNKMEINVQLESESIGIDEVVVVGYGTQKKATLTGAVTSIKAEEIMTTKSTRLVDNLQGKVSGLQIRANNGEPGVFNYKMQIRGYGDPLFVIDGVIRDGVREFSSLNPDDIESISILKDASAAVYGLNADNGVIIVTTKKGKSGKARFSYKGNYGRAYPTSLPELLSSYDYFFLRNEMDRNDKLTARVSDEDLAKYQEATEPGYLNTDWFDLLLKKYGNQNNHMLSAEGGSDDVTYFLSGAVATDDGLIKTGISNYERYNFRGSVSAKITKNLTADVIMNGKFDDYSTPKNGFIWFYQPLLLAPRFQGPFVVGKEAPYVAKLDNFEGINPWPLVQPDYDGTNTWSNTQYQSTVTFTYTVPQVEGLVLKTLGAFDGNTRKQENVQVGYEQFAYLTGESLGFRNTPASVRNQITQFQRLNFNVQASYTKTIAETHNLSANLVYEMRQIDYHNLVGRRVWTGIYTNPVLNQGDPTATGLLAEGTKYRERFAAYIGRLTYDYKSKYLLDFAFRYDGSYRYAPEKRWSLFPSVSGGWRVSEESFVKDNLAFLSNLKLRGSWGQIGRDAGSPFNYIPSYSLNNEGYVFDGTSLTTGFNPPGLINYDLTWILTETVNLGADVDLWYGKLGMTVDLFQKTREGLLANRVGSTPNTLGATFPQENLNSDAFKGIELSISHRNRINDFGYSVSANATYARQQIIKKERAPYGNSMEKWLDDQAEGRYLGRGFVYHQIGQFTSLEEIQEAPLYGDNVGNSWVLPGAYIMEDMNGDGRVDGNDARYAIWASELPGINADPLNIPLQFGVNVSMNYKNFDLNMLFQGATLYNKNVLTGPTAWASNLSPNLQETYLDRWHPADPTMDPYDPNTQWISGEWPALYNNRGVDRRDLLNSTLWSANATYMRLKNIELGYSLPKNMLNTLKIQQFRVYVNGFNLFTLKGKIFRDLKVDPEKEEGRYGAGLEYPLMKTFNVGVNITF